MIKKKLQAVQKRLEASLEEIRASHSHRGNRGSVAEVVVRAFLREYLPPDNRVGEGEIIDSKEHISTQLDIVITNPNHPYINDLKEPGLFLIEGVAAAGEVKTNLNSKDIDTLIQSCISYKNLQIIHQAGTQIYSNDSDIKRFIDHRPYFVFAFESQITIETIHSKLDDYYAENNTPVENQIDAVFCLDRGAIINFGDGQGALKWSKPNQSSVPGIHIVEFGPDNVLLSLLSWLSISIQRITLFHSPLVDYLISKKPVAEC
ncbi:MAG: hypothetical protein NTW42_07315 [Deltaproteobacteria bacterium]|nr:hypothetical protein [Deltaproteobacteria bacterium]